MELLLYTACSWLPSHILALYQYWDFKWRSKKFAILLVCLLLVIKIPVVKLAAEAGYSVRMFELVFSALSASVYFIMVRTNPFKLVFTYVLVVDYLIIARGIASFAAARLFSEGAMSWQCSLMCAAVYLVTMPWSMRYFRSTARAVEDADSPDIWRVIWLLPALASLVVLIFTNAFDADSVTSWTALIARLSLLFSIMVVCYVLMRSLDGLKKRAALEEQARQMENILNLQRAQYAQLQEYMEETRRASHDLRQHRNIIRSYLESGNEARLREYLNANADSGPGDGFCTWCRNYSVNMLLNHYAGRLRAQGTEFEFSFDLPEGLAVPESDLCVVLGNLLENALEACAGQEGGFVRAAARLTGSSAMTIAVDNSSPHPPKAAPDGSLLSTKHRGEGIGTSSIRQIALQYRGKADFNWQDGVFRAAVFLNLQAN